MCLSYFLFFFFQAEDGIRDLTVTGVQTCALPIARRFRWSRPPRPTATFTPAKTLAKSSSLWRSEKRGAERQLGAAPHKTNPRLLRRFREKGRAGLGVHFEAFDGGFGELRSLAVVDAAAGGLHTRRCSPHVFGATPNLQKFRPALRTGPYITCSHPPVRFPI